jgi:hypothetical protein
LLQTLADCNLFQQYVQRYHYLGYGVPYGAQLSRPAQAEPRGVASAQIPR